MPKSLEAFAQESGRSGRDGLPAHSILYYSQQDARRFEFLTHKQHERRQEEEAGAAAKKKEKKSQPDPKLLQSKLKALEQMVQYCTKPSCRRNALIRHFGGDAVDCGRTCDYCINPKRIERDIQSAQVAPINNTSTVARSKDFGWDGQWNGPHGGGGREDYDYDEYDEDLIANDWGDGMVGDLQVTDPRGRSKDSNTTNLMTGFTKASSLLKSSSTKKSSINSLLNKYEVRLLAIPCF